MTIADIRDAIKAHVPETYLYDVPEEVDMSLDDFRAICVATASAKQKTGSNRRTFEAEIDVVLMAHYADTIAAMMDSIFPVLVSGYIEFTDGYDEETDMFVRVIRITRIVQL